MNDELIDVSSFLRAKHIKMSANNEWLRGCCDFFASSNVGARRSAEERQNFVYEQWLLADLRDVGAQCLPPHIVNSHKCRLDGTYALQVNEVTNVGESAYSQLKHLRSAQAISTFCESEEKVPAWQPKHSRCLKLSLTDGTHNVFAMEYEPIPALREPFIPGIKILLVGPIECRRGVLLLTSGCIEVLGGEADSLLVPNATENIYARKLNLEENPNPFDRALSPQPDADPDSDVELDIRSVDSGISTTIHDDRSSRLPDSVSHSRNDQNSRLSNFATTSSTDYRNRNSSPVRDDSYSRLSDFGPNSTEYRNHANADFRTFTDRNDRNSRPSDYATNRNPRTLDTHSRTSTCQNWPPSTTSSTIADVRKENSPIVAVVTPIPSTNKRNAESPPSRLNVAKTSKTDSDLSVPTHTSTPSVPTVSVHELRDLAGKKSAAFVKCVAAVTRLIQKPRIKNDKWSVIAEIKDHTGLCHVTFTDGFLKRKAFSISAFEIKALKEKMVTNPAVRDQVDDMIRSGVMKLLAFEGQFHLRIIVDNELPMVVEMT